MVSPERQSDGDLVLAHLAGDPDAYSVLYERYFPGVHDFLSRLLRDRNDGADVTQDTFVKAIEQLPTLEDPDKFKSWLFAIAHRTALNRIRKSKRARLDPASVDDAERATMAIADPDPTIDPEQMAASQEAADIVWEAAAGLDERTYTVLDLHVRHGLESAEIAEVLGVTTGNAYTMVSRMKQRFTDALGTYLLVRIARRGCPILAGIVGEDVRRAHPGDPPRRRPPHRRLRRLHGQPDRLPRPGEDLRRAAGGAHPPRAEAGDLGDRGRWRRRGGCRRRRRRRRREWFAGRGGRRRGSCRFGRCRRRWVPRRGGRGGTDRDDRGRRSSGRRGRCRRVPGDHWRRRHRPAGRLRRFPGGGGAPDLPRAAEPISSTEVPATTAPDEPTSSTTLRQ